MKEGPNTSHTVEFLDPHNSQSAEKTKVNMLNGKPIWTVLILQNIEHCQYGKTLVQHQQLNIDKWCSNVPIGWGNAAALFVRM